jgi:hypothetical protein
MNNNPGNPGRRKAINRQQRAALNGLLDGSYTNIKDNLLILYRLHYDT